MIAQPKNVSRSVLQVIPRAPVAGAKSPRPFHPSAPIRDQPQLGRELLTRWNSSGAENVCCLIHHTTETDDPDAVHETRAPRRLMPRLRKALANGGPKVLQQQE